MSPTPPRPVTEPERLLASGAGITHDPSEGRVTLSDDSLETQGHGMREQAPDTLVDRIKVVFALDRTDARCERLRRVAEALEEDLSSLSEDEAFHIDSALLSDSESRFLLAHIHTHYNRKLMPEGIIMCELGWRIKPESDPPDRVARLLEQGWSSERFLRELSELAGDEPCLFSTNGFAELPDATAHGAPVLAPTLNVGGNELESNGAEFSSDAPTGLGWLRWSKDTKTGSLSVWVTHNQEGTFRGSDTMSSLLSKTSAYIRGIL